MRIQKKLAYGVSPAILPVQEINIAKYTVYHERYCVDQVLSFMDLNSVRTHRVEAVAHNYTSSTDDDHFIKKNRAVIFQHLPMRRFFIL